MANHVVCIGSVLIDELFFCEQPVISGTSNPAVSEKHLGGVIANIAQHLAALDIAVDFITVFGNDSDADWIKNCFDQKNIRYDQSFNAEKPTGKYVSILHPDGALHTAACSDASSKYLVPDFLKTKINLLRTAAVIIADTNIEVDALSWLINFSNENNQKLIIEPVSVAKAQKLSKLNLNGVFMITPNEDELPSLLSETASDETAMIENLLSRGAKNIWVRKGAQGSVIYAAQEKITMGVPSINITDSTGAGDAALAAWVYAFLNHHTLPDCLKIAHTMALEVLQQRGAVLHDFHEHKLVQSVKKYYVNDQ